MCVGRAEAAETRGCAAFAPLCWCRTAPPLPGSSQHAALARPLDPPFLLLSHAHSGACLVEPVPARGFDQQGHQHAHNPRNGGSSGGLHKAQVDLPRQDPVHAEAEGCLQRQPACPAHLQAAERVQKEPPQLPWCTDAGNATMTWPCIRTTCHASAHKMCASGLMRACKAPAANMRGSHVLQTLQALQEVKCPPLTCS